MTDNGCLVCHSTDVAPNGKYCLGKNNGLGKRGQAMELPLLCCNSCGFVYVSPLPGDEDINRYYTSADFWQAKMSTSVNYKFSSWSEVFQNNPSLDERLKRAQRQFAYINRHTGGLGRDISILDVGAGFSPFLYICKKNNLKNLYAIEPLEEICNFLDRQGVNIAGHTIEGWIAAAQDKRYDLIVVSHVLEHLKDPLYFLSKIGNFLAPNGLIYIEVPNRDDRQKFHCGLHFYFFNAKTLRLSLERYNFRAIDIRNVKYNLSGWIIRGLLLLYYSLYIRRKNSSLHNPFFCNIYYKLWLPIAKLFIIRLYIYISSNDIISLSRLADDNSRAEAMEYNRRKR